MLNLVAVVHKMINSIYVHAAAKEPPHSHQEAGMHRLQDKELALVLALDKEPVTMALA